MPKQCLSWHILDVMVIDGSGGEEFFGDSGVVGDPSWSNRMRLMMPV